MGQYMSTGIKSKSQHYLGSILPELGIVMPSAIVTFLHTWYVSTFCFKG